MFHNSRVSHKTNASSKHPIKSPLKMLDQDKYITNRRIFRALRVPWISAFQGPGSIGISPDPVAGSDFCRSRKNDVPKETPFESQ